MSARGIQLLRRGETNDQEDWHTSHRLGIATGILRSFGIERNRNHTRDDTCALNRNVLRDNYCQKCHVDPLPEWVTDDVLRAVWGAADALQTARGRHNRSEARKLVEARS